MCAHSHTHTHAHVYTAYATIERATTHTHILTHAPKLFAVAASFTRTHASRAIEIHTSETHTNASLHILTYSFSHHHHIQKKNSQNGCQAIFRYQSDGSVKYFSSIANNTPKKTNSK